MARTHIERRPARHFLYLFMAAALLALGLTAVPTAFPVREGGGTAHAAPAGSTIRDFLLAHRKEIKAAVDTAGDGAGGTVVDQFLGASGWHCPSLGNQLLDFILGITPRIGDVATALCWQDTAADPSFHQRRLDTVDASRAVTGTVNSGDPTVPLNVRTTPSTSKPVVRTLSPGAQVTIFCQTRAETVLYGPWAPTNVWDYIGDDATGMTQFVTDGSMDTGSNDLVTPQCPDAVAGYGAGVK
ncbi:hypothetical protein [Streptomyces sp. NPDC053069]|uniref:hypothetical protein n=1 Tax=Streptomyces sp. NPDC053069 TaxID=3365695 RepID=UPI0037CDCAD3